ncbi:MAG: YbaB/EbfC family nucleoid-associated protein [Nocardia sp.]|nr:YbaB/EbfC family nucleoid-associated protein [Nocardia sp.]
MQEWEREQIRSANDGLRQTLDSVRTDFEREIGELEDIQAAVSALRIRATTPSGLAKVTIDGSGQVVEIEVFDDAFGRCTPKKLTQEINAALRGGVEAAAQQRAKIMAPVRSVLDGMADLDEVLPGMPSMRELRERFGNSAPDRDEQG